MDNDDVVAMNFWYELDFITNYGFTGFGQGYCNVTPQMLNSLNYLRNLYDPIYRPRAIPSQELIKKLDNIAESNQEARNILEFLTNATLSVMTRNFGQNLLSERSQYLQERAFIHFGQGTLYDDIYAANTITKTRRPLAYMIHKMDGGTALYFQWLMVFSQHMNNTDLNNPVLLQLLRYIGFSAEIDFKQEPKQIGSLGEKPDNHPMDIEEIDNLKIKWLGNTDFNETREHMRFLLGDYFDRINNIDN